MVFANADALQDFERHWAITVLRWYSQMESGTLGQALLMNENTGDMVTLLEVIALTEAQCSQNRDGEEEEQMDAAV